jgi:multiple sugar transport system substrate-binding protein
MWGVSRFSKYKEAAYVWCDYYRSRQAAVNEIMMETNEPWNLSVLSDDKVNNNLRADYLSVVKESLKETRTEIFANQGLAYKIVIREIQNALIGKKTAKKALDDAQAEINKELK